MSLDFSRFKTAVATQFAKMAQHELFCVDVDKDALWNTYLDSFPAGTNEIYRKRREYDCSCCRSFIKRVGNVVAIIDGELVTIWDGFTGEPAFDKVSAALEALVRQHPIDNKFLTPERTAGTDKNFEQLINDVKTWSHFFVNIPGINIKPSAEIGPILSDVRASHDVLLRSLTELTNDAANTVSELIAQGSLYRGDEHKATIAAFLKLKHQFNLLPPADQDQDLFVWHSLSTTGGAVARIRNTAIGTLLIDLSGGLDLEDCVRKYEAVVAPANYKRPTALVTQRMVDAAKATVEELGLTSALARRYATIDDVPVTDLLYVDRSSTPLAAGDDVFSGVANKRSGPQSFDKIEIVSMADFVNNILPTAKTVEVMLEGQHGGNLMSLVTATDPSAASLFKWGNPFSWSYNGDLADSIKERVKQAGGSVEGDVCCRLAWYNHDDLDFHMREPWASEISFQNKGRLSPSGGMLDVDMNAGGGHTRTPVENIFYKHKGSMKDGTYVLYVHQYAKREMKDVGFDVEIDIGGDVTQFSYSGSMPTGKATVVAEINYHDGKFMLMPKLPATQRVRTMWGIETNRFHRLRALCFSPNYWGDKEIGNMHFFFILDGCKNEGTARGFYNEFLRGDLDKHRKVIEIVGSKMRTEESDRQLSGLGFSNTKRAYVLARVTSTFARVVKIEI